MINLEQSTTLSLLQSSKLSLSEQKFMNSKWVLQILIILSNNKLHSYGSMKRAGIPESTLTVKLQDLVQYKFIEKFIYGNPTSLHYTDYKITPFGVQYLDNVLKTFNTE